MAVDTRDKRFSLLSLGQWKARVVPTPDGSIDTGPERSQWMLLYAMTSILPNLGNPGTVRLSTLINRVALSAGGQDVAV